MIVLDTHILIWWVSGIQSLSSKAKALISKHEKHENSLLLSSISAWEIAMLVNKGRLSLNMEVNAWLAEVAKIPAVKFVPIDNVVCVNSTMLPGDFHQDPADRMIVALARQGSHSLVTADKKLHRYEHVKTLW